jgi:PAS domain S-box-containing protein
MLVKIIQIIKRHMTAMAVLAFSVIFYITDVLIDVYIFKEGTIGGHFFDPEPFEIYYRGFVVSLFIVFGIIIKRVSLQKKAVQDTLKLTEDKYRIVAENTYDWEFWTGSDRKFIYTSPAAFRITGYPPEKFENDADFLDSIIHPEDIKLYDRHRIDAETKHGLHEVEFRIKHADGSIRWISHACQPVFGKKKEFLGIRGANRDITLRKQAEINLAQNESKYRNLFESMLNGFALHKIILDENGRPVDYEFIEVNDTFKRMTGLMDREIVGRRVTEVIPGIKDDDFDWIGIYGRVALNNEKMQFEQYSKPLNRWFNISAYSTQNGYFVTVFEDISERKKIENLLRDNQERTEAIFEAVQAGVVVIDRETHIITYANKQASKMIGLSANDIIDRKCNKFICLAEEGKCPITDLNQDVDNSERCVINAEGEMIPIIKTVTSTVLDGRDVLVESFVDITERKKTEQVLKEKIDTLNAITNSAQDAIIMMNHEGRIIFWNPAAERILGFPAQEAIGQNLHELIAPDDFMPKHLMAFPEFQKTGRGDAVDRTLELRAVRKDGREIDVELSMSAIKIGDEWNAVGLIRDITQRLVNERAIRESENLHRSLFEAAGKAGEAIILMQDIEDTLVACIISNEEAQRITGYSGEELKKMSWLDLIHPDFKKVASERARRRLNNESLPAVYNVTLVNKAGQNIPIEIVGSRIDYNGRPALVGYFRDVMERQKSEAEIKKLNTALDQSSSIVVVTDINGSIEYVNKAFTALTGYSPDEVIGKNPKLLKSGEKSAEEYRRLWQTISSGKEWTGEFHNRKKNGELYWEQAYITAIKDDKGRITNYMAVKSDVTERKQSEEVQAAIYKISEISVTSDNLLELYAGIHMVIDELMNTANFYIALYDKELELLEFPYFVDEKDQRPISRILKKGLTEYVLKTGASLMAPPAVQDKLVETGEVEIVGTPSIDWIGVPLKAGGVTFGALVVQSYREQVRFGPRELSMLNFVSDNIAAAIQRKKADDERTSLLKELQESLRNIKTLKGLIPICSNCKKIRNDSGYWQQVEVYVSEHSDADFSHGLCDECAHELYPQYFKNKKNKTEGQEIA